MFATRLAVYTRSHVYNEQILIAITNRTEGSWIPFVRGDFDSFTVNRPARNFAASSRRRERRHARRKKKRGGTYREECIGKRSRRSEWLFRCVIGESTRRRLHDSESRRPAKKREKTRGKGKRIISSASVAADRGAPIRRQAFPINSSPIGGDYLRKMSDRAGRRWLLCSVSRKWSVDGRRSACVQANLNWRPLSRGSIEYSHVSIHRYPYLGDRYFCLAFGWVNWRLGILISADARCANSLLVVSQFRFVHARSALMVSFNVRNDWLARFAIIDTEASSIRNDSRNK